MRKIDIEKIIKQGSTKQKIKLYFTDIALFNTVEQFTAEIKDAEDILTKDHKEFLLTNKERDLIFNSIKDKKDVAYYERLRVFNRGFLMFKPIIKENRNRISYLTAVLSKVDLAIHLHSFYENVINDILEEVEDKNLRDKLVNKALESLKDLKAKKYQKKGFLPFIDIPELEKNIALVIEIVEKINTNAKDAKEFIEGIKLFLNKDLPLQPYKKFIADEEAMIKKELDACREIVKALKLSGSATVTTTLRATETVNKTAGKKRATAKAPIGEAKGSILTGWDEIEVEITAEDIEDIKSAGR